MSENDFVIIVEYRCRLMSSKITSPSKITKKISIEEPSKKEKEKKNEREEEKERNSQLGHSPSLSRLPSSKSLELKKSTSFNLLKDSPEKIKSLKNTNILTSSGSLVANSPGAGAILHTYVDEVLTTSATSILSRQKSSLTIDSTE